MSKLACPKQNSILLTLTAFPAEQLLYFLALGKGNILPFLF